VIHVCTAHSSLRQTELWHVAVPAALATTAHRVSSRQFCVRYEAMCHWLARGTVLVQANRRIFCTAAKFCSDCSWNKTNAVVYWHWAECYKHVHCAVSLKLSLWCAHYRTPLLYIHVTVAQPNCKATHIIYACCMKPFMRRNGSLHKHCTSHRTVRWASKHYHQSELYLKTQSVPRSKHCVSVMKTSQLMLYREIIAVCSEIHTKHIHTVWAERGIRECCTWRYM
jgi:hypothetical protein